MQPGDTKPIVVVGGGIAGLSAAWALARAGRADVVVIEAAPRLGGVAASEARDGFLLEHGPDSWLSRKTAAAELCRELGLEAELIPTLPQPGRAQIYCRGRLRPLPAGWRMLEPTRLAPVLRSSLLGWSSKALLAARWRRSHSNPIIGDDGTDGDESVGAYLRRRFGATAGAEMAAAIVGPLLGGVYGGDVEQLSVEAISPPGGTSGAPLGASGAPLGASGAAPAAGGTMFTSLRGGMGSLISGLGAALAARLPADAFRLGRPVRNVTRAPGGGFRLLFESGASLEARALILATPAWQAAALLAEMDPALAGHLGAVVYASSVNVNLAYAAAPPLPAGFGFLVPRTEGRHLLACTFAHQKFPHRAAAGGGLLRLFYGAEAADWSEAEVEALARRELRELLGITTAPDWSRICCWPRAMPQYTVGFAARAAAIAQAARRHPGLRLAGSAYGGIGIPDCIVSGQLAASGLE